MKQRPRISDGRDASSRRAIAVVELALVLPVLFILILGMLEICEGIFLKQKIVIASHEGARIAVRRDATISDVQDAVSAYLQAREMEFGPIASVVSCTPAPEEAKLLEPVVVRVEIDVNSNLRMPLSLYKYIRGETIVGEVTMFKEYDGANL